MKCCPTIGDGEGLRMGELREWPEMCLGSSSTSGKMLCKLTYGVAHVHRFPSAPTWPCRLRKADSVSCSSPVGVITGKFTPAGDIATVPYSRIPVSYFRTHGDCSAKAGARLEVTLRVHSIPYWAMSQRVPMQRPRLQKRGCVTKPQS
jgi:hypothetical protein